MLSITGQSNICRIGFGEMTICEILRDKIAVRQPPLLRYRQHSRCPVDDSSNSLSVIQGRTYADRPPIANFEVLMPRSLAWLGSIIHR